MSGMRLTNKESSVVAADIEDALGLDELIKKLMAALPKAHPKEVAKLGYPRPS